MLNILHILLSVITLTLAGYGLITKDFQFQTYMMIALGLTMLVLGLKEFKRNKKFAGWMLIAVFAFLIYVSIQNFIWNY